MPYHATANPDPAWGTAISCRQTVLWLSRSTLTAILNDTAAVAQLLGHPWHSIYLDGTETGPLLTASVDAAHIEPLTLRVVNGDPDDVVLAANRIPIYCIPPQDTSKPVELLTRLKMFQRIPAASIILAVVDNPSIDLSSLKQALQTAGEVREVVVISTKEPTVDLPTARAVHWGVTLATLKQLLATIAAPKELARRDATVVIQTTTGIAPIDLSRAVDASYPITERFEFIPSHAVLAETKPDEVQIQKLLESSTASWTPYASGVVFDRTPEYETAVRKLFKDFRQRGADATCTCWIDVEQASGATTLLRHLLFKLAREGYPVLVARPDTMTFDFQQLGAFFRAAASAASGVSTRIGEIPWILAFDVEHTTRSDDFVTAVANGLRKLNHPVLVIALRPLSPSVGDRQILAKGQNTSLGTPMKNTIGSEETQAIGAHINLFLPVHQRRQPNEWKQFAHDSERLTGDGKQSLFWVALRFWLFRMPGSNEPLRKWLADKLRATVANSSERLSAVLAIAALSHHRIPCPARLLTVDEKSSLTSLLSDSAQPLGLRELWAINRIAYAFAHPLIAEELMRVCAGDTALLALAQVSQCAGLLDFELSLYERLLTRTEAGLPEVIPVVEELVTSALRVDPREAPRNYAARERIVMLLESVPDSVFDGSQLFLHQLAKGRRHLASDPPLSEYWNQPSSIREQLELAEAHLVDAITTVIPKDEDRREKPLNLHVSLAITYDVRSRFEENQGNQQTASEFASRAQKEYHRAQELDPDNTYVLENFARFKLRQASDASDESVRLNFLVDCISLLEWELAVDDSKRREGAVLELLCTAFTSIDDDIGLARIEVLAESGSEAASVALARLLATPAQLPNVRKIVPQPDRGIALLRAVPSAAVTWRSRLLLYQLISERIPCAFNDRLDPLDELNAMTDFPWPLQIRLEYGILLYQLGRHSDGRTVFQQVRDMLPARSSGLSIPTELKFLADVRTGFTKPLLTSLRVTNATSVGRNFYGIPAGWGNVDVPFRPYLFGRKQIRNRDDIDCYIQFTSFGPQAVPSTEA